MQTLLVVSDPWASRSRQGSSEALRGIPGTAGLESGLRGRCCQQGRIHSTWMEAWTEGGKLLLTSVISSFPNSRPWDLDAVWPGHSAFVAGVRSLLCVLSCSNHTGERAVRDTMGLFSLLLNTRPQTDGSSRKQLCK